MSDVIPFSPVQQDRLLIRLLIAILGSIGTVVALLLVASLMGVVKPGCDGMPLNNRVGQCYVAPNATSAPQPTARSLIGLEDTLRLR